MIYDSRTDTVKLHHKDKVYLAGALGVLKALCKVEGTDDETRQFIDYFAHVLAKYRVYGDEHLKRPEKTEVAKSLIPDDDAKVKK